MLFIYSGRNISTGPWRLENGLGELKMPIKGPGGDP